MRAASVDALVLTPGADQFYLSGFEHGHAGERLLALVLRSDGSVQWIVPAMNVPQVETHAGRGQSIYGWTDAEGYRGALARAVTNARTIAFDDEARAAFLLDVVDAAPPARIVRASTILRSLRMRKDAGELSALRAAAGTVDEAIPQAMALCRAGRTEAEIDRDLRGLLVALSPESSVAFTIVAGGENAALPHHETSARPLRRGDVALLDYGTRRGGYHSDITIVCSVGEPADPEVRKVYRVVWEAQQAALSAVRPGVRCEEVDRAARAIIEEAGYGANFLHRTGHGLGLQVHEPPYIVAGNDQALEEGMVFSIEPGIYLPGRFGVRLEVIASVGADGVSLINAPRVGELPTMPG